MTRVKVSYDFNLFLWQRSGIRSNDSKFSGNKAAFGGALAWLTTSKGIVVGSHFDGNSAQRGGALFLQYNNLLARTRLIYNIFHNCINDVIRSHVE